MGRFLGRRRGRGSAFSPHLLRSEIFVVIQTKLQRFCCREGYIISATVHGHQGMRMIELKEGERD
jgi:hypothetical protein